MVAAAVRSTRRDVSLHENSHFPPSILTGERLRWWGKSKLMKFSNHDRQ